MPEEEVFLIDFRTAIGKDVGVQEAVRHVHELKGQGELESVFAICDGIEKLMLADAAVCTGLKKRSIGRVSENNDRLRVGHAQSRL